MKRTLAVLAAGLLAAWPIRAFAESSAEATPEGAPPGTIPPPPQHPMPPPESQRLAPPPAQLAENGQWVYTSQYGWVFMPYGDEYVYTPPVSTGQPYFYVYYPTFGWRWVVAPWVWGIGPHPYFGRLGAWRFPWYRSWVLPGRRLYRSPAYRVDVRRVPARAVPGRPRPRHGRAGPAPGQRRALPASRPGQSGLAPAPRRVKPQPRRIAPLSRPAAPRPRR